MGEDVNKFDSKMQFDEYGVINLVFMRLDEGSMLNVNGKLISLSNDAEIVASIESASAKAKDELLTYLKSSNAKERVIVAIGVRVDADSEMVNQRNSAYAGMGEEEIAAAIDLWRNIQGNPLLAESFGNGYFKRRRLPSNENLSGTRTLGEEETNSKGKEINHSQSRNDKSDKSRHFDPPNKPQSGTRELG